jgi:hypothetical protein
MATPAYRYHMKVDGLLPHPCPYSHMVCLDTVSSAAPTRLLVNPVKIFSLTGHRNVEYHRGFDNTTRM